MGARAPDDRWRMRGSRRLWPQRQGGPLIAFLMRFPSSDHAMATVEEANAAFDDILGRIPDLAHPDTTNFNEYVPAEIVPIVSRYDSAAARLPAAARTAANQYTTEIWTRLGMPGRRH